jgi:prepilin-type N-terminal cleavage/methylation domain-containing protein
MKALISCPSGKVAANQDGFTLTELMVTMSILLMVLAGALTAHLFGAHLFQLTKSKLGANQEARQAISMLIEEIRTGKLVKIGDGDLSRFTEVSPNSAQIGSAIQVYPTTDTNSFIRYFWDGTDKQLKRTTNGATAVSIVANSITNQLVFTAEDFRGTILTNNQNNRVIGLTLQFYQIQYPIVMIGPGQYYDFYQLRTKITRRALE